jgi:hypothetical protein
MNKFDLKRAIAGEPLETVGGIPVDFVAYQPTAIKSHQVVVQVGGVICTYTINGHHSNNRARHNDLRMKLIVNKIDWNKLPVDTRIILSLCTGRSVRYFSSFSNGMVNFYRDGTTSKTAQSDSFTLKISAGNVQIAPDQPWTVWQGGSCPIPDGLEFEYMIHEEPGKVMNNKEGASASAYLWQPRLIYAYRLTGCLLDGWKHD